MRFTDDSFTPSFITTTGIDFKIRTIELDGKRVKLQIWNTASSERFRPITTAYYRGAMGVLLVYDVTDKRSFDSKSPTYFLIYCRTKFNLDISSWNADIERHAAGDINKMLIGNNCDSAEGRVVSMERGQALAYQLGIPFLEVSSKSSINIDKAFYSLAADVVKRLIGNQENKKGNQTNEPARRNGLMWPWWGSSNRA